MPAAMLYKDLVSVLISVAEIEKPTLVTQSLSSLLCYNPRPYQRQAMGRVAGKISNILGLKRRRHCA